MSDKNREALLEHSRLTDSKVTASNLLEGVTAVRSYVTGCTIREKCELIDCEMRGVLLRSWGRFTKVRMRNTATSTTGINIVGGDYSDRSPLSSTCGRWLAFEGGPGMMQVGCERHSLTDWLAGGLEQIANAHDATRFEIEVARDLLAQIIRWQFADGWNSAPLDAVSLGVESMRISITQEDMDTICSKLAEEIEAELNRLTINGASPIAARPTVCPDCRGKKVYEGLIFDRYDCPTCNGTGKIHQ